MRLWHIISLYVWHSWLCSVASTQASTKQNRGAVSIIGNTAEHTNVFRLLWNPFFELWPGLFQQISPNLYLAECSNFPKVKLITATSDGWIFLQQLNLWQVKANIFLLLDFGKEGLPKQFVESKCDNILVEFLVRCRWPTLGGLYCSITRWQWTAQPKMKIFLEKLQVHLIFWC